MAAATKGKPYIRTKINVETPEEAKEREARGEKPPVVASSEDDEDKLK